MKESAEINFTCQNEKTLSPDDQGGQILTTSDIVIHASASEPQIADSFVHDDAKDASDSIEYVRLSDEQNEAFDNECAISSTDTSQPMPVIKIIQALGETKSLEENSIEIATIEEAMRANVASTAHHMPSSSSEKEFQECEQIACDVLPGCVAPAPTPVPVMAPLAEDEIYSVDEEQQANLDDTKCSTNIDEGDEEEEAAEAEGDVGDVADMDVPQVEELVIVVEGGSGVNDNNDDDNDNKNKIEECKIETIAGVKSPDSKPKPDDNKCNTVCPWEDE